MTNRVQKTHSRPRRIKAGVVTYEYIPSRDRKGYELIEVGELKNALMVPPLLPTDVPLLMTLDPLSCARLSHHITLRDDVCIISSFSLSRPSAPRRLRKTAPKPPLQDKSMPESPWWGGRQIALIIARADWDRGPYEILQAAREWHETQQNNRFAALSERRDTVLNVALPKASVIQSPVTQSPVTQTPVTQNPVTQNPAISPAFQLEHQLENGFDHWLQDQLGTPFTHLSWGFSAALDGRDRAVFASDPNEVAPVDEAPDFRQFENHLVNGLKGDPADYMAALDAAVAPIPDQLNVFRPGTIAISAAIESAARNARCFAPSTLREIARHRWLAQAVFDAVTESPQDEITDAFHAGLTALMHLSDDATLCSRLMARFARADQYIAPDASGNWHKSDWITTAHMPQTRRMVLQRLNSDTLVDDIDHTWGKGAAMALGQKLAGALRKPDHHFEPNRASMRPSLRQLSADSPVMGRA